MSTPYDYRGDVEYEVWRMGGNPDCVDPDRCRDAYDAGIEADDYAAGLMRRRRERIEEEQFQEEPPYPDCPPLEYCLSCGEPTGKPGRDDGSLYCEHCDSGPFCEECYNAHIC